MKTSNSIPDPSQLETIGGIFDLRRTWCFQNLESCIPGIVMEYDRKAGIAKIQPLVKKVLSDGTEYDRSWIPLPVMRMQHGSFLVDAPIHEGDTGWIIGADRHTGNAIWANNKIQDIDTGIGKEGNQGSQPPTGAATHKYQYGFFLPDKWGGITIPDEYKDSLVIQQISPDSSSHGRFVMDRDGTVHVLSTRWYDADESDSAKRFKGGVVAVDLSYKHKDPLTKRETWQEGEIVELANEIVKGNLNVVPWVDDDETSHGGNLTVANDANIGGNFWVELKATLKGMLNVLGESLFKKRVVVEEDSKRAIIDPKNDLFKTDAKFREMTVVTGFKGKTSDNVVKLETKKVRVLSDEAESTDDVKFEVGNNEDDLLNAEDINIQSETILVDKNVDKNTGAVNFGIDLYVENSPDSNALSIEDVDMGVLELKSSITNSTESNALKINELGLGELELKSQIISSDESVTITSSEGVVDLSVATAIKPDDISINKTTPPEGSSEAAKLQIMNFATQADETDKSIKSIITDVSSVTSTESYAVVARKVSVDGGVDTRSVAYLPIGKNLHDNKSLEYSSDKLQIAKWDDPTSVTGSSISSLLESSAESTIHVLARDSAGAVKYLPVGVANKVFKVNDTEVAKFIGTADVNITTSSEGAKEITVITGITFSTSSESVICSLSKSKLKVFSTEEESSSSTNVFSISSINVVDTMGYNSSYQIYDTKKTVYVVGSVEDAIADSPIDTVAHDVTSTTGD